MSQHSNLLSIFWKSVGGSPRYPASLKPIIQGRRGWIAIVFAILFLITMILLVAAYITKEAEKICRSRLLALAFATILATFPIMLG
jgi:hypothetical protein